MGKISHSWKISPKSAISLQKKLAGLVDPTDRFKDIRWVAGADVAFSRDGKKAIAGVILYHFPELEERERVHAVSPLSFPYVPGLLSFREGPVLLKAFRKLKQTPDLIFIDGQGLAHPRRLGIASHLGLLLNIPTLGCAKSRLCGEALEPGPKRGSRKPLRHRGEIVGSVLRTRDRVKPVFISSGHRVGLKSAIHFVLKCHDGTRIPKPTREADHYVAQLKREL